MKIAYFGITSKERSHRETLILAAVQEALTYALKTSIKTAEEYAVDNFKTLKEASAGGTVARIITQEFWHSLNRKGIIKNDEVESLIDLTLNY